jgi:hypothetical protein
MRRLRVGCIGVLALGFGCTKVNPLDCSNGHCADRSHPYCDVDGAVGGVPHACIAVSCSAPSTFVMCSGDSAIACDTSGNGYVVTPCDLGCSDRAQGCNQCTANGGFCEGDSLVHCGADSRPSTMESCPGGCVDLPGPHCGYLEPLFFPDECDVPSQDDLTLTASTTLDTGSDDSCDGGIIQQFSAPDICVVHHRTIALLPSVTLTVTGPRALALLADNATTISGTLDVSAHMITPGAGGGATMSGGDGGSGGSPGGGGAGFKIAGGPGATTTDGGGMNGGAAVANPAASGVLIGGPSSTNAGGGGAVTIVACRGSVSIEGIISAGGGGGAGGSYLSSTMTNHPPFGGGAGGAIVLQGLTVTVSGGLYANGGGGGGGIALSGANKITGGRGEDASTSRTVCALGGTGNTTGGSGGTGACGARPSGAGHHATMGYPGGGGGSVGFIQVVTPSNVTATLPTATVSPDPEPTITAHTR